MHVLPGLALLSALLAYPQLRVIIEAVLPLDGRETDAATLLYTPVLGDQ